MKSRIFLALLLACAVAPCAARAQAAAQQVPAELITVEEFKRLRDEGKVLVLDVRYDIEVKIKGATHVPLDLLESMLAEIPRDREIVTYCSCPEEHTSARAAQILRDKGYKARALLGGWAAWKSSGGETEPAAQRRPGALPQDFPNPNAATQQNASPSTDGAKTPAVSVKDDGPAGIISTPMKPKTTAKRKSKRHRRGSAR